VPLTINGKRTLTLTSEIQEKKKKGKSKKEFLKMSPLFLN
jgi:hypothetical protein